MTTVPPTQPPAAPEGEVRLTEAETTALSNTVRDVIGRPYGFAAICRQVERIVAERVRVVEGERDALAAAYVTAPSCEAQGTCRALTPDTPEDEVTRWSPAATIREAVDTWAETVVPDGMRGRATERFTRAEVADWFYRWADSQDALPDAGVYADDDLFNAALRIANEHEARAESAEAALAELRARVEALADEWSSKPDDRYYDGDRARALRALLGGAS